MTTNIAPSGLLPRSSETYEDYLFFLAAYYFTYKKWKDDPNPKKSEFALEIMSIMEDMAQKSHLPPLSSISENDMLLVKEFASYKDACEILIRFYKDFKTARWNREIRQNVKRLYAVVALPLMKF